MVENHALEQFCLRIYLAVSISLFNPRQSLPSFNSRPITENSLQYLSAVELEFERLTLPQEVFNASKRALAKRLLSLCFDYKSLGNAASQ